MKRIICIIFLLLTVLQLKAQLTEDEIKDLSRETTDYFNYQNYINALYGYEKLLIYDSTSTEYNHRIAICYLNTELDKKKAVSYLEIVVGKERFDPVAWYDLGEAYMHALRYDDAIMAFNKYKKNTKADNHFVTADRQIEMCNNAKELVANPIDVEFENMGELINSPYPDFNPYIPRDESFLIFTSKRAKNIGNWMDFDGYSLSDILVSEYKKDKWQEADHISSQINSAMVEEVVGLSADGTTMFIYMDNMTAFTDIYKCEKGKRSFDRPESLGMGINSSALETSATISLNKKVIFFVRDVGEKSGGLDVFVSRKLPSGEWSEPENIGAPINTAYDEDFPVLDSDGETFYFSSMGHNSMGGFDIFKSTWDKEANSFTKPVNIGYPINTSDNETSISYSESGRHAYIAAVRDEGFGCRDIYRLTFPEIEMHLNLVEGEILNRDSLNLYVANRINKTILDSLKRGVDTLFTKNMSAEDSAQVMELNYEVMEQYRYLQENVMEEIEITIHAINKYTKEEVAIFRPNEKNGRYVMVLPPGEYLIEYYCNDKDVKIVEYHFRDHESAREQLIWDIVL
jgi:WD40-like Beta Propeller Repeat